jgi:hypothetical protein
MTTTHADPECPEGTVSEYNYRHFGPEHYDFRRVDGPGPGQEAPDFRALTLDGREVELSGFRARGSSRDR